MITVPPPAASSPRACPACSPNDWPVDPDRLAALEPARIRVPLLLAGGILGALAFPSPDWWPLAWVALLPTLLGALTLPPRLALRDGWLQGTVFFVLLLRWLDHTFRHYSAIPWPLTWLPIVALAAYCGLYFGAAAFWIAWTRGALGRGWALALVPPLWVAGEWLRGWLLGGFPWGLMGYSQRTGCCPLIQIAELTGVYGVSFLIVAVNCALAGLLALGWTARAAGSGRCRRAGAGHARVRLERAGRRGPRASAAGGRDTAQYRADTQVGPGTARRDP